MWWKKRKREIQKEIDELRQQIGGDPVEEIKRGTWFTKLVAWILTEHAERVNAEYFTNKYPGLDKERIAHELIRTAAVYTGIAGGVAAAAVSAAELTAVGTGGASLWLLAGSLLGEIAFITRRQLQLIYDISVVLDAPLDRDDPQDILVIFWFALGVNIWEHAGNLALKVGPRGAAYLGRKALRSGLRKAVQKAVAKFGGVLLARRITERAILRLIVPGINVPIAYALNRAFTKALGRKAIVGMKHRGAAVHAIDALREGDRRFQLLALPLIYHIGIVDEPRAIKSRVIEMQDIVGRRLQISEEEHSEVSNLLWEEFDSVATVAREVTNAKTASALLDIGICAHLFSENFQESENKVRLLSAALGIDHVDERIARIKARIE